jgi:uncharacterized protein YgiM (DUF1202 family)
MRNKIIVFVWVLGIIFMFSCQPVIVDNDGKGTLAATRMTTVKAEPNFNASDVATVNKDEKMVLIYTQADWYRVRLHNQMEGWIHKTLVKATAFRDIMSRQEIGLRWKPTESSAVSQIVPAGTKLKVLQESGEWMLLQPDKGDNMGWVSRSELNRATSGMLYPQSTGTDASTLPYTEGNVLVFTNTESNIRSGPGTENTVVSRVKQGTKLGWQQSIGDWFSVSITETNQMGYIHRPLVTEEPYRTIETQNESNFRAGPGLNYVQIDRLPKGIKLKLLSTHAAEEFNWYLVERPSTALAWIRSDQTDLPSSDGPGGVSGKSNFGFYFVTTNANVSRTAGEYGGFTATLLPGQNVEILSSKTANWYEIKYSGNKRGFVQVADVTSIRNKPLIVNDAVNLRESSSEKSAVIDRIPAGSHVLLIGVEFGWCLVKYGVKTGWVAGQYLTPEKYHSLFVSKEKSYFRQSPSSNAATLGEIVNGEEIFFFESKNNWYRFQEFDSKQSVWISDSEVDVAKLGFGFTEKQVTPRAGPGNQYPQVLKPVRPNVLMPILKEMLNWYQVMIPGQKDTGWVPGDLLTRSKDRPLIALVECQTVESPNSNVNGALVERGAELIELNNRDGWHYVAAATDKGWYALGWVETSKVAPTRYGQITLSQNTTVYYGPGTQYAPKTNLSLNRGASVQIVDIIDGWYQIESFNNTGWIKGR